MNFAQSNMQSGTPPTFFLGEATLISLLTQGIHYLQQGQKRESLACFTMARTHPQATDRVLMEALDALIASQKRHWQAEQALHEACTRFVEAEQAQTQNLHTLQLAMQPLQREIQTTTEQHTTHAPDTVPVGEPLNTTQATIMITSIGADSQADVQEEGEMQELALTITCFGRFEVRRNQHLINLGSSRSGQTILRYLVAQPDYSASKDALIGLLWPDLSEEHARRKLQVAISTIRCTLNAGYLQRPGGGYIIYREPRYLLNPAIPIRTDVGEFLTLWHSGQQADEQHRIPCFEQACTLCTAPFLADDLFADWSYLQREELNRLYLTMCHELTTYYMKTAHYEQATHWGQMILKDNHCDELAHRQLMRIYTLQGARNEAIRQYQQCAHLLHKELGVCPLSETQQLFQAIMTGANLLVEGAQIEPD